MNKTDEVYISLLKAKENVVLYNKEKAKDKNWNGFENGIIEKLDDVILSYSIMTEMSADDILNCYFEVGADNKDSIYHDKYCAMKMNI